MQTHTRTVEDHAHGWTFIDATRTGLTETSTVVSGSVPDDLWFGSSGSLVPGYEARLVSADGKDIHEYNQPGELLLRSPSIVLGYFKNEKANKEAFEGAWLRTGDEAVVKESPNGNQHIWIVDRLKELIKVKVRVLIAFCLHCPLTKGYRVIKWHRLNSRLTFLPMRTWPTVRSSVCRMKRQESVRRPS